MQNLQKINLSTPIQTEYSNKMSSQRGKVTPYYSKDIGNEWVVRKTPLRWQNCQSSLRQNCSLTKGKISIPRLQSRVVSSMNSTHPHIFNLWGIKFLLIILPGDTHNYSETKSTQAEQASPTERTNSKIISTCKLYPILSTHPFFFYFASLSSRLLYPGRNFLNRRKP